MPLWKKFTAVVLTAGLISGLAGCSGSSAGAENETSLTLGLNIPVTTFSTAEAGWGDQAPYLQAVYDTILRADPNGSIVEGLATAWEYNEDNTVLTLTIRDGVEFTDGTALDADAVAQNLLRFRDSAGSLSAYLATVTDVTTTGPNTVVLTLSDSNPALLTYLTMAAGLVQSPAAFENTDLQTNPVGSGPYVLDTAKTVVGTSYVFEKKAEYWNPESVHYDAITINVYGDTTALLNAIKGGQVNAANFNNNNVAHEIEASGFTLNSFEPSWAGLLLLDRAGSLTPALGDVRVRQAINHAFDKDAMIQAVGVGYGTATTQVIPETSVGFDSTLDDRYPYDLGKAKELMAEAGYADGFTINLPTTAVLGTTVYSLIQEQLGQIGITVNYTDAGDGASYVGELINAKVSAGFLNLQQDQDWALIGLQIAADGTFNPFHTRDPQVDALTSRIHDATGDEYATALRELNAHVVEQAWFAPWYRSVYFIATDETTSVTTQVGNSFPYLWNFIPA
ncbi:ABC transporter substrate-binding protein [Pseudarthrobacter sp. NPDC058329]|uniref:ABC transporter substrate-binding protein n=1 Tax=Pseudarthrobacter sp. NPDC058329 TaxID=3346448 RepID=UPI0036D7760B